MTNLPFEVAAQNQLVLEALTRIAEGVGAFCEQLQCSMGPPLSRTSRFVFVFKDLVRICLSIRLEAA